MFLYLVLYIGFRYFSGLERCDFDGQSPGVFVLFFGCILTFGFIAVTLVSLYIICIKELHCPADNILIVVCLGVGIFIGVWAIMLFFAEIGFSLYMGFVFVLNQSTYFSSSVCEDGIIGFIYTILIVIYLPLCLVAAVLVLVVVFAGPIWLCYVGIHFFMDL